jgi:hypothetical protein
MRRQLVFCASGIVLAVSLFGLKPAGAETLMEKAELWGAMHGYSIHCRMVNSHEFGVRAVQYFRQNASGETFERLRDAYGLKIMETARQTPPRSLGGDCGSFRVKFMELYTELGE